MCTVCVIDDQTRDAFYIELVSNILHKKYCHELRYTLMVSYIYQIITIFELYFGPVQPVLAILEGPLTSRTVPFSCLFRLARAVRTRGSKGQGTGSGTGFLRYFHTWLGNYLYSRTRPSIYSSQTSCYDREYACHLKYLSFAEQLRASLWFTWCVFSHIRCVWPLSRSDRKNCVKIIASARN